jgi:hypothetical protein
MSLLLDALKKAALDKRKHDLEAKVAPVLNAETEVDTESILEPLSDDEEDEQLSVEQHVAEKQIAAQHFAKKNPSDESLTFEIEFPDDEIHSSVVEFQPERPSAPLSINVPDSLERPLSELRSESPTVTWDESERENDLPEPDADSQTDNDEVQNATSHQTPANNNDEQHEAAAPARSQPSAGLALVAETSDHQQSQRKAALSQLLRRSQLTAARNRRRKLFLLAGLLSVSIGIVTFYYYYLVTIGTVEAPFIADAGYVAPDMVPESEEESIVDTEVDYIEPAPERSAAETPTPVVNFQNSAAAETATESTTPNNKTVVSTLRELSSTTATVQAAQEKVAVQSSPSNQPTVSVAANISPPKTGPGAGENIVQFQAQTPSPLSLAIREGYSAYQHGDLTTAQLAYEKALRLSEHHRDALLGAAAVAHRQGRQQDALRYYQHRLARAPKDDYALAGILAMANGKQTGSELDSEVNRLLIDFPQASHLHFLKGSLYAARQQWGSAQLSFFNAWRWDSTKPDYAYNLAVALDHLNQPVEALRFYNQALALTATVTPSFNIDQVVKRINQLGHQSSQKFEGSKQ